MLPDIKNVGGDGTAYRYGGEEFTLVFPGRGSEEVIPHLEAIRETIAKTPFVVHRRTSTQKKIKSKTITISLGLADSIGKKSVDETMKLADKALFKAKKKGRNKVCL